MIRLWRRFVTRHPVLGAMWEAVGIGLSAIRAYKMRAGLTILGVVMGIMTVTGMSSIVAGLNASMARQIETLGPSLIFIRPGAPAENISPAELRRRKGLTPEEVEALAKLPAIEAVSPLELTQAELIKYGNQRVETAQVIGGTPEYEPVHELYVERGRFVSQADVNRSAKVVVLGADIIDALFPWTEPLGKELNIDGRRFRVIGVIERRGKFLARVWTTSSSCPWARSRGAPSSTSSWPTSSRSPRRRSRPPWTRCGSC